MRVLCETLDAPGLTRAEWLASWLQARPVIELNALEGAQEPWVQVGVARGWMGHTDQLP